MLHTPAKLYTPHQPYIAPKPNLNFLLHTCIVPFERSEDTRSILFSFAHPLITLYLSPVFPEIMFTKSLLSSLLANTATKSVVAVTFSRNFSSGNKANTLIIGAPGSGKGTIR